MVWWSHLSSLGGLNVTGLLALAIAAWFAAIRCWRLALAWCLLFGAVLAVAAASQMAFLGWGLGIRSVGSTGFSGHATRAHAASEALAGCLRGLAAAALKLSGHDRVWLRRDWQPAQAPYVAPCAPRRVRFGVLYV